MYIKIFTFHAPEKLRDRYSENNRDSNLYIRKMISNRLNNTNTVLFLIISVILNYCLLLCLRELIMYLEMK